MRVCLLATADNPHFLRWARYLIAQGHELLCLCDRPGRAGFSVSPPCRVEHPQPNFVEAVVCFKIWRHRLGWHYFRTRSFRKAVRAFRPDVVHGMEALAYGYALSRCKGFPRVLTPWGNDIFFEPERSPLARFLVGHALSHVEAITTNMPNLAEFLVPRFGVAPERVRAFSWGVDRGIFHPGHEAEARRLREAWRIPEDAIVFLSPRHVEQYWGAVEIAEAIPRVLAKQPRAFFILLRGRGDRALEDSLRRGLEEANAAHRVHWVGEYLTPEQMAAALNLAFAFISIPRTDMLSISVLEGMGCGCLPVAADLLAYRTRLVHGENAILIPTPVTAESLAEGLVQAAAHPEWREAFARRNVQRIAECDDAARNAHLLEEVYRWAIAHPLK